LNIPFYIFEGDALQNLKNIEKSFEPISFYFDFSPLKGPTRLRNDFAQISSANCYLVDTYNVIPTWITSDKEEFGAYTIRPKINKLKDQFLVDPQKVHHQTEGFIARIIPDALLYPHIDDFEELISKVQAENPADYILNFIGGDKIANKILQNFIQNKLENYGEKRNDPSLDFQSDLSPYLHFGQISSLRVILEIQKFLLNNPGNKKLHESAESFTEEILVRKELSDNYCYYNKNYNNFNGLKSWENLH
jgi:deoxyribodipyrimidine photo-lyase